MSSVREWLEAVGLPQYGDAFETNEIGMDLLAQVDDQTLKDIGISIAGHRLRIRSAIAKLPGASAPPAAAVPATVATAAAPQHTGAATPAVPQGTAERRQLTVMFCDLVGSTALSTKLDPEDLRGIINAYHRCCTDVVERNGGFVAKYMGDGVLAYFGYPRADEHDAERSVGAALALADAVPKLATAAGPPLQVRVGIATGLVVVGDLIGTGAAQEQAVVGETPNLAARLQALAEPAAVVISATTRQLTGGLFEYRDLGTVALKGFPGSVPAWQVLGEGTAESRFEALRATTTPLVGREEEIGLLLRRWEQAKLGEGQLVLICGEPGIGKSRIAQSLVERISNEPHTRLRFFCSPHHQDSVLYPNLAQLERAAAFRRDDSPAERLTKLETVLAQGANDLREVVPLIAALLSIPTGDRYPPPSLTPQKRKERTLQALVAQVEGLSARHPVLVVFEDVHWSDPTSRELLDLLIERMPAMRVLATLTFRPEFTSPWVGRPHVSFITLNRLPPRKRAEMVLHLTGGRTLPKEITDQIVDRTDGVPLFIEELTKDVVESGIVTAAGDRYATAGPVAPLAIPTSLHASLLARLDRLAPTREIVQIGAALGRSFSHELISAVAQMPQQQIDDALVQLVRSELIFRRGAPPDAEYTFKHALVQDAAYSTLPRSRRQRIHARIVATLESQFPEIVTAQPELMAHHCSEATLSSQAIRYRLKASHQAKARFAMVEAETQLRKGLELLALLPEATERQQMELELQFALGWTLMVTHGYAAPPVTEALSRARRLCEQLDRPSHLALILVGECIYHSLAGQLVLAYREAAQIVDLGESRDDVDAKFQGLAMRALAQFHLGNFNEAYGDAKQAIALYDPTYPSLTWWPTDPYTMTLMVSFRSVVYLGHLRKGRAEYESALSYAERGRNPHDAVMMLGVCNHFAEQIYGSAYLLSLSEKIAFFCGEHTLPYWQPSAAFARGKALCSLSRSEEGVVVLGEGLAAVRATGAVTAVHFSVCWYADALGQAGRATEGLGQIGEVERHIEATEERWIESDMHRVRGELLMRTAETAAAEQSLQRAITVARQQNSKFLELRAAISLARLWRNQGRMTEAHDVLAPVYDWFTEGFDTPVLKEANALLGELGP